MRNHKLSERAQTAGFYYFARKMQELGEMEDRGKRVVNLGIGNPDLPPPPVFREVLNRESAVAANHGYQPYGGLPDLKQDYEAWLQRHFRINTKAPVGHLPLAGSKEGIFLLSQALLDPGDEVLVPDPGYAFYRSAANMAGALARPYSLLPENRWMPDPVEMEKLIHPRTRMIWLNNPHMPTGAEAGRDLLTRILELARKNNTLLVNDNPYALLSGREPFSIFHLEDSGGMVAELHSMSKAYNMAGWRLGFLTAPGEIAEDLARVKMQWSTGIPQPLQMAAATVMSKSDAWLKELRKEYNMRRTSVWELCRSLGCTPFKRNAGMFVWSRIPENYASSSAFTNHLLTTRGIFMAPGNIFGGRGEGYVRTSLCAPLQQLKQFIQ